MIIFYFRIIFAALLIFLIVPNAKGQDFKAYDDYISISPNTTYVVNVIENDNYSKAITLKIISYTNNGNAEFDPNVTGINLKVRYKNEATNKVEYEICDKDPQTQCSRAFLYINITNDEISAANDVYFLKKIENKKYKVLGNDLYTGSIKVEITSEPKFGTAKVSNKQIEYQPNDLDFYKDSLEYKITNSNNNESRAYVYFYGNGDKPPTNAAPQVSNFLVTTEEDESFGFQLSDFNSNYSDDEGDPLTKIKIETLPNRGVLYFNNQVVKKGDEINNNEVDDLLYEPNSNYFGSDKFEWQAADAGSFANTSADVMIEVTSVNDLPVAVDDEGYTMDEDGSIIIDVLQNDSDVETSQLEITDVNHNNISYKLVQNNKVEITPSPDYCGELTISYTIEDEDGGTAQANIFLDITCLKDVTKVNNLSIQINEDQEFSFFDQLFKDATNDPDGNLLEAIIINDLPNNGVLYLNGEPIEPGIQIKTDQIASLTFIPESDWHGATEFAWQAITNATISENEALFIINVLPLADDIIIYDAFSPNGDNLNDQWIIGKITEHPENEVKIFNRHNLLIFQLSNYNNETNVWKGETNVHHFNPEHLAPDDIYYFVISLIKTEKVLKGPVTLKR